MFPKKIAFLILFLLISMISSSQNKTFLFQGRVEKLQNDSVILIGSASSVSFNFIGNECSVSLQSVDSWEHHNYVSLVLDGKYMRKLRIEKGAAQSFPIQLTSNKKEHTLEIYKTTEAHSGGILFAGTTAKLTSIIAKKKKKIEFIGDSITCGAASDPSEVPCDKGEYFDHHNGYYAYGPVLSRAIGVDYLMSSVSGIGMYRNWNDENKDEAIMPDVYQNLYLTNDTSKPKYDFAFQPDIISIALGTNDFSGGDGKKERLPFNAEKYVSNYINFIKMLYKHNQNAQIVITNSPMINGQNATVFEDCLNKVKAAFAGDKTHKPIVIFKFKPMTPKGCSGHPDVADHKVLANEYGPFLKMLLNEK